MSGQATVQAQQSHILELETAQADAGAREQALRDHSVAAVSTECDELRGQLRHAQEAAAESAAEVTRLGVQLADIETARQAERADAEQAALAAARSAQASQSDAAPNETSRPETATQTDDGGVALEAEASKGGLSAEELAACQQALLEAISPVDRCALCLSLSAAT